MSKKTIGILGCGWLGKPLAVELSIAGFDVRGTSRDRQTLDALERQGIQSVMIDVQEKKILGDLQVFLQGLDILLIDIPPGLRQNPASDFAYRMKMLMSFARAYDIPQTIFISSTSVFKDTAAFPIYTEEDLPNASSSNAQQLIAAEEVIQEMTAQYCIIRPGGLIGGNRHPVTYLSGRQDLSNPDAPVNLVERSALIKMIKQIIDQEELPKLVHGISIPHEPKESYYQEAARQMGISLPKFDHQSASVGKRIQSIVFPFTVT
ncbi:NAD(P)H-binding protein [Nonlabens xiamenensis]|uniref:NAD(P)H-binding protein n=1 Tax=Nonlabens xiamenensis TaxID=2341043 RepID=UPI000F614741|nr:NAD(P)H-binding protein [Nonlabens xiamenensis]